MLRRRIYELLEVARPGDRMSQVVDLALVTLIAANVVAVILESIPGIGSEHAAAFATFERLSVAVFSAEYVLRIWSCTADPGFAAPVRGRLRFALEPMPLVDLLAIAPSLLGELVGLDLRVLRALRLLRLLRLLKLARYANSLQTFARVLRQKTPELVSALFVAVILLLIASSLMYAVEREAQPDAFSSIPATMWWGVTTLTTVGYGDMAPITPLGRVLGACVAVLGVGMFAIPAGILASAFGEELRATRAARNCPHCGETL
jgi:voltage-gated potassium channel